MNWVSPVAALLCALSLAGCANNPPPPDWQMSARDSLQRAVEAYLSGQPKVELAEFARARAEIARTGRAELLARAELVRCATRVASLVFEACQGFDRLALDADMPERAYAAYIGGQLKPTDVALLAAPHRAFATPGAATAALKDVADPLTRLVAAGVLLRNGVADPMVIKTAIDTASAQGWRRPLLAWLGVQVQRAGLSGDTEEVARIRRRMDVVGEFR